VNEIDYYKDIVKPGRETRLYNEWKMIDTEYSSDKEVSYSISKRTASGIPVAYEVTFLIKSITGVEDADEYGLQKPVFGERHVMTISIPNNFPSADGGYPEFKFITDVWHPNIRFFGDFKGHVCLNFNSSGTSTTLCEHIGRVVAYLRYDDYHALNEYPYPEDQNVAKWVLEQAEPQGWINLIDN
jgi:Ubiquitin-protein ligase